MWVFFGLATPSLVNLDTQKLLSCDGTSPGFLLRGMLGLRESPKPPQYFLWKETIYSRGGEVNAISVESERKGGVLQRDLWVSGGRCPGACPHSVRELGTIHGSTEEAGSGGGLVGGGSLGNDWGDGDGGGWGTPVGQRAGRRSELNRNSQGKAILGNFMTPEKERKRH